jgi:peptidoglycan/xylan/chitin deacetylase (PgdA/CDA1 family)
MKYSKPYFVIIISFFLLFALVWRTSNNPKFQLFGSLVYRLETNKKVVALTFDDGPSPNNTIDILNLLNEYSIKATFFMIGQNIERYPEIASAVFKSGHDIGNHTYSHQRTLFGSVDFFRDEIQRTDELIRKIGYQEEIFFRPPFGKKLINLPLALKELEKTTVTWDVDSKDTKNQDPNWLKSKVLTNIEPGSIILFHDGFSKKEGTITTIRAVIEELKKQGYTFLTINELLRQQDQ